MYFIRINSISYVYFRSRCTHGQTSENEQPYNHHIEYWSIIHGFLLSQFWEQSSSDDAAARRGEYTQLVGELEEELMQILNKSES